MVSGISFSYNWTLLWSLGMFPWEQRVTSGPMWLISLRHLRLASTMIVTILLTTHFHARQFKKTRGQACSKIKNKQVPEIVIDPSQIFKVSKNWNQQQKAAQVWSSWVATLWCSYDDLNLKPAIILSPFSFDPNSGSS